MRSVCLALSLVVSAFAFAACGDDDVDERVRCATCGMVVPEDSGWRAGGESLACDAPQCLFRRIHRHWLLQEASGPDAVETPAERGPAN